MKLVLVGGLSFIGFVAIAYMLWRFFNRSIKADRVMAKGEFKTLFFIFLFVVSVLLTVSGVLYCAGIKGSSFVGSGEESDTGVLWALLYHCMDPGNLSDVANSSHRVVALLVALFGIVVLNGVLISSIVNLYERFVKRWEKGLAR